VVGAELLLDGLDQELRNLWRAQLVPRERGFASLNEYYADGVGGVVDGYAIWETLLAG
jgi:hypothetical protein